MNMYMLYTPYEMSSPKQRNFLSGTLSYIARESSLLSANIPRSLTCDILVISAERALPSVASAIHNEARLRNCPRVFLDATYAANRSLPELCSSLTQRGLKVFLPFSADMPQGAIPVVEASVTGGFLSGVFEKAKKTSPEFAVSFSPMYVSTPLPADNFSFRELSRKEVFSVLHADCASAYFSPQMLCRYFLTNPAGEQVHLFLFDDAETLSSKIRLAKKHGASHAFFVYSEISGMLNDMFF